MQTLFYLSVSEQQQGPFALQDVANKLKAGEVEPTDYIFVESVDQWLPLLEYKELQELIKPKAPSKPAPKTNAEPSQVEHQSYEEVQESAKHESPKEEWYVLKGDHRYGPFSYNEMLKMLQEKQVFEFDYVWKHPMDTWHRVAELESFHSHKIKELSLSDNPEIQQLFFRRRHSRVEFGGSLIIHDNQKVWHGDGLEISEGGAGIQMNNAMLLPGQKIFVHFKPSDGLPSFNALCEIVNKKYVKGVKNNTQPLFYGVKFISINGEDQQKLKQYTANKAA